MGQAACFACFALAKLAVTLAEDACRVSRAPLLEQVGLGPYPP